MTLFDLFRSLGVLSMAFVLGFWPVSYAAKREALPKPIVVYQKRLNSCSQYLVEENWSKTLWLQPKRKGLFGHLHDGYRCYRLQQDFDDLREQYQDDAQARGTLDAMQHVVSTVNAAFHRK